MHGSQVCEYATKRACDQARRELMGRCVAMTQDKKVPTACDNWATSSVDDRNYCSVHAGKILNDQIESTRVATKRAELSARIESFLVWTSGHPSVWDRTHA